MFWRRFLLVFLFLAAAVSAFGQTTTKQIIISGGFTTVAGTPRVVRNTSKNFWVVTWRQQGAIKARTVKSDGTMLAAKNLAIGASSSEFSFDLAYNTDNFSYLLAFENAAGLQVRAVNANLVPGAIHLVEAGARGCMPRLIYDAVNKRYVILWLGQQDGARTVVRTRLLDTLGAPTATTVTVASAGAGKTYGSLSAARNPVNGNILAMALQQTGTTSAAVQRFNINPAGAIVGVPSVFQPAAAGLLGMGEVAIAANGIGFGFWNDKTLLKKRKTTSTGGFGSGITSLAGASVDTNSRDTGITFSSSDNQFLAVWAAANTTRLVGLNATTGAIARAQTLVGTTLSTFCRNAGVSADPAGSGTLIVWEDSNQTADTAPTAATQFRVRGAILGGGGGGGTTVSVSMVDNSYSPGSVTITAGTTVEWTNNGQMPHTVTSGAPGQNEGQIFESGRVSTGGKFRFTFNQRGQFPYFCTIHGSIMSGLVTVN